MDNFGQYQNNYQNQNQYQEQVTYQVESISFKRRILNFSAITGILGATLLLIGLLVPSMDFSVFHESVDFQYNIIKICENVRLISPIWTGLPWGIIIGIVLLYILSLVRIPQFKLIPCIIVVAMFVIMIIDMNNVISWVNEFLNSPTIQDLINTEITINKETIIDSFQSGIYLMAAGTILGIISCFAKPIKE